MKDFGADEEQQRQRKYQEFVEEEVNLLTFYYDDRRIMIMDIYSSIINQHKIIHPKMNNTKHQIIMKY
jgi:hypothetical protein